MRAATNTIPFPHHRRRRSDTEPLALVTDTLIVSQERRSRRLALTLGIAATALVINGIVVTTLFQLSP